MAMNETDLGDVGQVKMKVLEYEAAKSLCDELDEQLKEAKAQKDRAEKDVIMALLEIEERTGIDDLKVKVADRNYGVKQKDFFSIPATDRAEAYRLLKELGHGDIVVERVDDRTLSNEMAAVIAAYRAEHPHSEEEFPAEYEELLSHMKRFMKPSLSRVIAK